MQIRLGLRNILLIVLIVVLFLPMFKAVAAKWLDPDNTLNTWIQAV